MLTTLLTFLLCLTRASSNNDTPYPTYEFDSESIATKRQLIFYTSSFISSLQPYSSIFNGANQNSSTTFLTIDCDADPEVCNDADINAYPTIRLIENSEGFERTIRYRGPRTKRAIKAFVKRHELPLVSQVQEDEVKAFGESGDVVVLATLPVDGNKALLDILTDVASDYQKYIFGYTTKITSTSTPSITIFKSDGDHRAYTGGFTVSDISAFVKEATPSVIKTFREKEVEAYMQRDKLTLYIFTPSAASNEIENDVEEEVIGLRKKLTPLAKKFIKHVVFGIADLKKHGEMAQNFLSRASDDGERMKKGRMRVVVHAPMNDNVFFYAQGTEIEERGVEKMLMTILQGKAKNGEVFSDEAGDGHDEL